MRDLWTAIAETTSHLRHANLLCPALLFPHSHSIDLVRLAWIAGWPERTKVLRSAADDEYVWTSAIRNGCPALERLAWVDSSRSRIVSDWPRRVGYQSSASIAERPDRAHGGRSRARRRHSNADIRPSVVAGPQMSVAGGFRTFAGTRSGDKVRRLQTFPPSHRNEEVRPLRIFLGQVCGRLA
jgi:hypothetical protein